MPTSALQIFEHIPPIQMELPHCGPDFGPRFGSPFQFARISPANSGSSLFLRHASAARHHRNRAAKMRTGLKLIPSRELLLAHTRSLISSRANWQQADGPEVSVRLLAMSR
jgi:hypothetical protein